MLSERHYMRHAEFRPEIPGWKLLVLVVLGLAGANAVAWNWGGIAAGADLSAYELLGRNALAGHHAYWTALSYALVETHWLWGLVDLLLLGLAGRLAEDELTRPQFFLLCAGCALAGAAAWLPLHWHDGESLQTGTQVLVLGLLTYACFTLPDEPRSLRLFMFVPVELRLRMVFWVLLAVETAALLTFELPQALGLDLSFHQGLCNSAHLGAMGAGWLFAFVQQRLLNAPRPATTPADLIPQRWLKALPVGAGRARATAAADARSAKPAFATRRELREELDRILDKINQAGFGALTADERQLLEKARDLLKK